MNEQLRALCDRYWQWALESDVHAALAAGKPVERLRPISEEIASGDAAFGRTLLADLDRLPAGALSADERISVAMLRHHSQMLVEAAPFYWHEPRVTPYAQPFQWVAPVFTSFRFTSGGDLERYRSLLEDYRNLVESAADFALGQRARGLHMPFPEVGPSRAQIAAHCTPEGRAFLIPAASRLNGLSAQAVQRFSDAAAEAVHGGIAAAFARLLEALGSDYAHDAPQRVGLGQYAGGDAFYAHLIRRSTTLDLPAERIHELGIVELERIGERLETIRERLNFPGDLEAFYAHLRTDRRFFASSAQEMGSRLDAYVERAAARVPEFFGKLPAAAWQVQQLPDALAGAQTFGYYQPPAADLPAGTYYFNGSSPAESSMLCAASLMLHELVPGHHLQIALQQENADLPAFRRYGFTTSFCEGYAEYAAELGFEMGMYAEPYEEAGRLLQDAMISARLVVDTGLNRLGWTLEQARVFMARQTMLSAAEIEKETLRYSCDLPAQALAYKIGETAILEVREAARGRYGRFFDLRAFHDWLLGLGAVTLDALREAVSQQ